MTVRLVILGLLRVRPLYGYEIKQVIEEHMSDWTSIAFGSIYFALDKLEQEKFVEKVEVGSHGKRPARSVYQITGSGRKEFLRLLRASWQEFERVYYPLDICLFFLDSLPLEEVRSYLRMRRGALEEALAYVQDHRREQLAHPEVPELAAAIFDHTLAHTRAELKWLKQLLRRLEARAG
jgi:DNA-binding PadR family transcriptional regulator